MRRAARLGVTAALALACAAAPLPGEAQSRPQPRRERAVPWIEIPADRGPGWAPWALADAEARLTIVSGLPAAERYRVCNESNTPAVVATDAEPEGLDLPPRSCVDVGARTIRLRQPRPGIPARGSFVRLD